MSRRFLSWSERPLRALAAAGGGTRVGGRLQAAHPLEVAHFLGFGTPRQAAGKFELLGPGDVVRLAPSAITRRYPAPGAPDAEETKAALVELEPDDLPWRYSPEIPRDHAMPITGKGLRPWLVLVAGTRGPGELAFSPDGRVGLGDAIQQAHPLAGSWRWAHVHEVPRGAGTRPIARILCPRDLDQTQDYTACLVPAFVLDGADVRDAWPKPGGGTVWLPCYDSWSFRTGEDGDFPQLASLLEVAEFGPGSGFGVARVRYRRRGGGEPREVELTTHGALRRADADPPPVEPWVADEVEALTAPVATTAGRWILTAPRYAEPFTAPDAVPPSGGWASELTRDPRRRGSAGLGAWTAIAWQDRIAEAAAERAGDLGIVRDRVNHVTFGIEASRALWRRRVPQDPVAALGVLGPVLGRLPAPGAAGFVGLTLTILADRTPLFVRALWSSAARRALRPGPARTSLAQPGAADFPAILGVAGRCPDPTPDPAEPPPEAGGNLDQATLEWEGFRSSHVQTLHDLIGELRDVAPLPGCEPVDLGRLGGVVTGAVDPTVGRPIVVDRVLGDLDDLGPVELEPELDLPIWSFLAERRPDWLLPGVGELEPHRVVGLATNPAFVEAVLAGANHQATAELRFRNLPLRPRWSPLRKFWQRAGGKLDIEPIKSWPASSPLGGPGLQAPGVAGEAVVLFRTPLFKRYPGTVVYLYDAGEPASWIAPAANAALDGNRKVFPTFAGKVGDDVVFFAFPIAPGALAHHWVVLEEPPTGYRFYTEDPDTGVTPMPAGAAARSAAEYGFQTFAVPVRVMIADLIGAAS